MTNNRHSVFDRHKDEQIAQACAIALVSTVDYPRLLQDGDIGAVIFPDRELNPI
jgi:hypothetical protein